MLLLQTQVAIHTSQAMVAESKRDRAYVQQVMEGARQALQDSRRRLSQPAFDRVQKELTIV